MFGKLAFFALGVGAGVAITARLKPANTSNCCARVAVAARAEIGDRSGLGSIAENILDKLGLTAHLPSLLDAYGVPIES